MIRPARSSKISRRRRKGWRWRRRIDRKISEKLKICFYVLLVYLIFNQSKLSDERGQLMYHNTRGDNLILMYHNTREDNLCIITLEGTTYVS